MRRPFIAGNWKMNSNRADAIALATAVADGAGSANCDVAICPPSVYIDAVVQAIGDSSVGVGAQNAYAETGGAFTGELSPQMLVDIGCKYVILGHSERRQLMGETDAMVNAKVKTVLETSLIPIVCVGETLEEREAGKTTEVVSSQFDGSMAGLSDEQFSRVVIAYEPVWAIGTGKVATPEQAEAVHSDLRSLIENRYNDAIAQATRIQYGGSVKPGNAAELLQQPNIDGALVGGAALKAEDFLGIINAA